MASITEQLGPGGGGQPFWGLNDAGVSSNQGPKFATDPWDTFWLGVRQLPGECTLTPGDVAQIEVNSKKGKGTDGARLTLAGFESGKFSVECQIATTEQWEELQDIVDIYWRSPGKTSNLNRVSVSVYHPGLAFVKIFAAVLYGVSPPQDAKLEGAKLVRFLFRWAPYLPHKKNVTKSSGPPAEAGPKPKASKLPGSPENAPPPPPETLSSNMSTEGPK